MLQVLAVCIRFGLEYDTAYNNNVILKAQVKNTHKILLVDQ